MYACQPIAAAPLAEAMRRGVAAAHVTVGQTEAYSIVAPVSGYRGVVTIQDSGGQVLELSDAQLLAAQQELARVGLWTELSSAAGLAGLRTADNLDAFDGPVVCVSTSSGFKNRSVGMSPTETIAPDWDNVRSRLRAAGIRD